MRQWGLTDFYFAFCLIFNLSIVIGFSYGRTQLFSPTGRKAAERCTQTLMSSPFNIQEKLKIYFPILFELLNNNKIDWKKVEKTFFKRYELYIQKHKKVNSPFQIEASFYSIITAAIKNEKPAIMLLDYIQKLFEELTDNLDDAEKKEIKNTIFGFLTNIDTKYLNYLGELSVLNQFKRRTPFKLVKTEEKLLEAGPNNSTVDFKFLNKTTNEFEFVEIVSIHLNKKNTANNNSINVLLSQKISEKLLKKGLKENAKFFLVPVVWGNWREIKCIEQYYEKFKPIFQNTCVPVCFVPFTTQDGKLVQRFGSIDTIFANSTS